MNSKERKIALKKALKKILMYIFISIPLAFLFVKVIELKHKTIFWSFMAIMGISDLIADWYMNEENDKKSKFVKTIEHIAFISFITLMLQYFYFLWFIK